MHCVPIKTSSFYFMNNSVKNQVICVIFGTLNPEEISCKCYLACPPHLKNITSFTTVPCEDRSYASDQIFIAFLKNWMQLK